MATFAGVLVDKFFLLTMATKMYNYLHIFFVLQCYQDNKMLMNIYVYCDPIVGNRYILKMRVVDHIFDEFVVDHLVLRIILPEGCT